MLGDVEVDVAGLFETERGDVEIVHPWLLNPTGASCERSREACW